MQYKLSLIFILGIICSLSSGHIRLWEPPGRSTLWRDPRFAEFNPPMNTGDDGVYCGRILQPPVPVNCGVCGDPFADPVPRPNEHGGTYGNGIIAGRFRAGQEIQMIAEVTIPHNGSFHFQLCDELPESNDCFVGKPYLPITTAEGTFFEFPVVDSRPFWVNGTMRLPPGVSCRNCVLRVNYRSGMMGECDDGTNDYGCGLQQNFRMCADLSISL